MWTRKKFVVLGMALSISAMVIAGCGDASTNTNGGAGNATTSSSANKPAEKPETLQQQALKDTSVSVDYKNALKKGLTYANDMHMSKAKIMHQLTSEYGEKFPQDAAEWAVSHMSDVDWKANALAKAKTYRDSMSMSTEKVRQQLSSKSGEDFTHEEVDYAMQNLDKK